MSIKESEKTGWLGKYSFGVGDRFARQAAAQLKAILKAREAGTTIIPVWNKSFREHKTINSQPHETRWQADLAVKKLGWEEAYFVDADHVGLKTVDYFISSADFFTLDVADFIGQPAPDEQMVRFLKKNRDYCGTLAFPGVEKSFEVNEELLFRIAGKYLNAVTEAGKIYRHILSQKGNTPIVVEVSMDETMEPQTPIELFFILSAIAEEGIPANTIAPKFSGRFNKGIDYAGDPLQFAREFEQDLAVIRLATTEFGLPAELKLSVHSGSDKFSIYPHIRSAIKKFDAGLHLKTAGTTWLEELIGLALAGGSGLILAKEIYARAFKRYDELCAPYATVIDITVSNLPSPEKVMEWTGDDFANALRHDPDHPTYNKDFRQYLHVSYKVAAEFGQRYLDELEKHQAIIAENVCTNIWERHIKKIFI